MLEVIVGIFPADSAFPRNYPYAFDDSCFEFFNIVCVQLDTTWTIRFENHVPALRLTLRVKSLIIFRDHLSKSGRITMKQGLLELLEY